MKKNRTLNVHDAFFKRQMDIREHAAEIIRKVVPPSILDKLDLASLKNLNSSFTDGKTGNFQADVLYECRFSEARTVTITLLFEHKSYVEKYPHLQLLRYMLGIWDRDRQNNRPLTLILPIVFYHGQPEWPYKRFHEYFEGGRIIPELIPYIPAFEYAFLNLQELGDEWIVAQIENPFLRMALQLMRNIGSPELLEKLADIFQEADELIAKEGGREKIDDISLYLYEGSKEPEDKIEEVMNRATYRRLLTSKGTYQWRREQKILEEGKAEGILEGKAKGILEGKAEGILEGKAEGILEGKLEVAKSLLKAGMEPEFIAKNTGLDLEAVFCLRDESF